MIKLYYARHGFPTGKVQTDSSKRWVLQYKEANATGLDPEVLHSLGILLIGISAVGTPLITRSTKSKESKEKIDNLEEDIKLLEDSQSQFELYEDEEDKYRWRLRHQNGNILADSGQGYSERLDVVKSIDSAKRNVMDADIVSVQSDPE